jgi:hypothetical protein
VSLLPIKFIILCLTVLTLFLYPYYRDYFTFLCIHYALREERKLRVYDKVLRRIFAAKRDEVTGRWRKLHNEELHDLYSSLSIIRIIKSRRMRWAGHVARMGEKRNAHRLLVGKPEEKTPLGRPRRRCVDNIKMNLLETDWGGVD